MQNIITIKHFVFTNLLQKIIILLGIFLIFFVTKLKNHGSKHDHGFLWIKNSPMYKVHTNEKIGQFVSMYFFCGVSLLPNPLQNQHTCTCKEKRNVVCRFHYPFFPMHGAKFLEPLQINRNYPFSQQYFKTKTNKIFQSLKYLKENDDISCSEYINYLHLDESTYILSLRSKLTKLHI